MLNQFTFPGTFRFPRLGGVNPNAPQKTIELYSLILDFDAPLFVALDARYRREYSLRLDFKAEWFASRDIEAF